ncbi:MAG: M48 family metallopeptidase [Ruminococcus sp.]|jgi:predicted metal-dependent hydrolase|nr:M48 family metallopeptidase [Ruminococcus sp.]
MNVEYDGSLLYRGQEVNLKKTDRSPTFSDGVFYIPCGEDGHIDRQAVISLYKKLAATLLTRKAVEFSRIMGVAFTAIRITGAKTRWGSCNSDRAISFSWRLVMASDELIDYVVVHELSHIIELNHSKRFWAVVGQYIPDFKKRRERLKTIQKIVDII